VEASSSHRYGRHSPNLFKGERVSPLPFIEEGRVSSCSSCHSERAGFLSPPDQGSWHG
jgi:hypothetical protein